MEMPFKWKPLMLGLDEEQPDRAAVVVQVIENTLQYLQLHQEDVRDLRHNTSLVIPLIRTVIPNLKAWDLPNVEVQAFPFYRGDRGVSQHVRHYYNGISVEQQVINYQTYTLTQYPGPIEKDFYTGLDAEICTLQTTAEKAKYELDHLISINKTRPLVVAIHSMYFLPYVNLEYGVGGITLALRCALYAPMQQRDRKLLDFWPRSPAPAADVWSEPWF